jgi:L-alanine-DL-glutamate epimerase-like enolase superfamily enzyme
MTLARCHLKISEIETHEIHPPIGAWHRDHVRLFCGDNWDTRTVVVLRTDDGLEGVAEWEGPETAARMAELEPLLGTNPARWLGHPQLNIWIAPAIYDLVGKANDVPAYQLFGPKVRSWIPVADWTVSQTPSRMAEEVVDSVKSGFTWMKFHTSHLHNVIEQTRAIQEVAPPGFKLHYDVNFDNTPDHVLSLAGELTQFPVAGMIEDPLQMHDMEGHRLLREKCPLPIIFHHAPLGGREAMLGVADGYMLGHAPVGVVMRRAGLFEAANVPFMTQNNGGNITLAMIAHMAAAFERATLHHTTLRRMWEEDVVEPLRLVAGQVQVPESPGLGVTLDRERLEKLKARPVEPLARALIRVRHGHGMLTYARPPYNKLPRDWANHLAGVGEGYDNPVDQDYWAEDESAEFAELWEQTEAGPVTRNG